MTFYAFLNQRIAIQQGKIYGKVKIIQRNKKGVSIRLAGRLN
jgi:hypothetical protein